MAAREGQNGQSLTPEQRRRQNPLGLKAVPFIGRQPELEELKAALEDALSGQGRLVMLVGEPGIGKTRTSQELAEHSRHRDALVMWGRCYENPGAPPYWPWAQVIRSYIREKDPLSLQQQMGAGAASIAEIVSEVREQIPSLPPLSVLEDPDQARFRLFDSITNFFKAAAQERPLVLFLDNLHWADKPSLLLLEFLAQEIGHCQILVVGTYRDIELSRRHPLSDTLAELNRERLFQRIQLRGLSCEQVGHFIQGTTGVTPTADLIGAIHHQTEGNPLFITEVVRLLSEEGELAPGRLHQGRTLSINIPEGIKEVIGRRLNRLSEGCTQTLAIASVIGREFAVSELASITDHISEDRLLEVIDEAVATRVIEELPQSTGRYQFSHVLIRETLYEELTSARRVRLHRRIGEAMEQLYSADLNGHLDQLAYHFLEAASSPDKMGAVKAVDYASRAGERGMELLAYEEAARYYEMALQAHALNPPVDEELRCKLLLSLGEAQKRAGDSERAREAFQQAAQCARKLGSAEHLAQAAIGFEDASWRPGLAGPPAVHLLEEALNVLGEEDSLLRVKVLSALVRALYFSGLSDQASALTQEAVEMARRIGDPLTLVSTLTITGFSQRRPETLERRLAFTAEALSIAEKTHDNEMAADIYAWYLFDLLEAGDVQGIKLGLEAFQTQVERIRQPFFACVGVSYRASLAIAEGSFEEGEELAKQSLAICRRLKGQDPSGVFAIKMFTIRKEQGRLQEVAPALRTFEQQRSARGAWGPGLALVYSELGMESEARDEFERLAPDDFAAIPQDALQVVCLTYLTEVCAFLNDADRAATLYRLLLPWDGHNIVVGGGVAYYGSAGRYLGIVATIMSRWPDAERHFQDALEMDARMGAQTWLAHTQYEYAKMLVTRNQPGDREKAATLLDEAYSISTRLGMRTLMEKITALRQRLAIQPSRARKYPANLTERQVEVLRLLAEGKTNHEIAQELVLSERTVQRHIADIYDKIGARNRADATAFAMSNLYTDN